MTTAAAIRHIKMGNYYMVFRPGTLPKAPVLTPEVTHHIIVMDRSGSMYSDIDPLKIVIEQVLTVESISREMLTTLISFSSHGDVTTHWSREPLSKVIDHNNSFIADLRKIRATNLTGMSQALNEALKYITKEQTTAITLFTDGYANDPSPSAEHKEIDAFISKAQDLENTMLNCVGYRDWCDWPRLTSMSNALSGKTIQAKKMSDVLNVMRDTSELLSNEVRPRIVCELAGNTELAYVINRNTMHIQSKLADNNGKSQLVLRGINKADTLDYYEIELANKPPKVSRALKPKDPVGLVEENYMLLSSALAALNCGDVALAKAIVVAGKFAGLHEAYKSAATPSDIKAFGDAIQHLLGKIVALIQAGSNTISMSDASLHYQFGGIKAGKLSFDDFNAVINDKANHGYIKINVDTFMSTYKRRTVSRMLGSRAKDGTFTPPRASAFPSAMLSKSEQSIRVVDGLNWSTTEATLNMKTSQHMEVHKDGKAVYNVANVNIGNMKSYRDYTLISSGEFNVNELELIITSAKAYRELKPFMSKRKQNALGPKATGGVYHFNLKHFDFSPDTDEALFRDLSFKITQEDAQTIINKVCTTATMMLQVAIWEKILNGLKHSEASIFTKEQIDALAELHITPALYFSPPTCNKFASDEDFNQAVSEGKVDSYTRYKIAVGTKYFKNDLYSGNEFLDRSYIIKQKKANGEDEVISKPKLSGFWDWCASGHFTVEPKPQNPRAKYTVVDDEMKAIFNKFIDAIIGCKSVDAVRDYYNQRLAEIEQESKVINQQLSEIILQVGFTGSLPRALTRFVERMDAEEYAQKYNDGKKVGKDLQDAVFFVLQNQAKDNTACPMCVITVSPEVEYYDVKE